MNTEDIPGTASSNWQPIQEKYLLAALGKLGEEASELSSAIFRCIIQGLNEKEPVTGKVNRIWLEEEIADTLAMIDLLFNTIYLDKAAIKIRRQKKLLYKATWIKELARK